jgi:cytochrome c oxidase cbb3-type subunit 4
MAMEDYTAMRHFADSWGLVLMFGFFIAVIAFVFRPGSKAKYDRAANIPLRDNGDKNK